MKLMKCKTSGSQATLVIEDHSNGNKVRANATTEMLLEIIKEESFDNVNAKEIEEKRLTASKLVYTT